MMFRRLIKLATASTLAGLVLLTASTVTTGQTPETPKAKAKPKVKAKVKAKAAAEAPTTPLDLNKASAEEMIDALPGVGEATAKKIVAGRPYAKVDDLAKAGVPARVIEGIRSMVTVSAPTAAASASAPVRPKAAVKDRVKAATAPAPTPPASTVPARAKTKTAKAAAPKLAPGQRVNLNTASLEELQLLPGIGPVKSQAIIDARPFKTPEDVMKVKGIKEGEFSRIKDSITVK